MEIVSKTARKTLKLLINNMTPDGYIDYQKHQELIDKNELSLVELKEIGFIEIDLLQSVMMTDKGSIFPGRYKAKIFEKLLTNLWLPIIVAIISSIITNLLMSY